MSNPSKCVAPTKPPLPISPWPDRVSLAVTAIIPISRFTVDIGIIAESYTIAPIPFTPTENYHQSCLVVTVISLEQG